MASYVNMALEDIIKKRKRENKSGNMKGNIKEGKQYIQNQKFPVTDARLKIISKKRKQISDAREKLTELAKQRDARLKLEQMRLKREMVHNERRNIVQKPRKFKQNSLNRERVFVDPSRQVVSQPISAKRKNQNNKLRGFQSFEYGRVSNIKPIVRTVENDIEIIDDPMGDEEFTRVNESTLNRKASLQLRIVAHNNEVIENRKTSQRMATQEKERSPPRPTSILKKRPMAALRLDKHIEKAEKPVLEYRIIVSNLRNTVTGGDIEELFGDVGDMMESRLVRPGTAEVIYKTLEDAQRAVDLYHNRQLDGQPMNCMLVTPRNNSVTTKTKSALYSTNSNVEPDISTFHKVLFSNF